MEWITKLIEFFKSAHLDAWAVVLLLCVEAFLGATDLVKAGSTLEAILNTIKKVLNFIKGLLGPKA
jgi:TRAP-type C4-dicarboxylate transport system permease large subunit